MGRNTCPPTPPSLPPPSELLQSVVIGRGGGIKGSRFSNRGRWPIIESCVGGDVGSGGGGGPVMGKL